MHKQFLVLILYHRPSLCSLLAITTKNFPDFAKTMPFIKPVIGMEIRGAIAFFSVHFHNLIKPSFDPLAIKSVLKYAATADIHASFPPCAFGNVHIGFFFYWSSITQ